MKKMALSCNLLTHAGSKREGIKPGKRGERQTVEKKKGTGGLSSASGSTGGPKCHQTKTSTTQRKPRRIDGRRKNGFQRTWTQNVARCLLPYGDIRNPETEGGDWEVESG